MRDYADSARVVGLGILAGIIGAALTYTHSQGIGLGFAIYALLLVGFLLVGARLQHVKPMRRNLFLIVPILFFGVTFAIHTDPTLGLLNLGAGILAALLLLYFFAN